MMPRMVVFDLDDTLYPEAEFVRGGFAAAGAALDAALGRPVDGARVMLEVLLADGPFRVFDAALARLDVPRDRALVDRLVRAYRDHAPSVALHPGVPALLAGLRRRGVRLGVLTDGPLDVQQRKCEVLGLAPLVDVRVFCADVDGAPHPKPDPAAWRWVERHAGLAGASLCFVGDWPARDFPAPDALGWRSIRMRHPGGYHAADPDPRPDRPVATTIEALEALLDGEAADG